MRRSLFALLLLFPFVAHSIGTEPPLADAAQEARARALFTQFRCVVCQSESVADSPADIARSIRTSIREQVQAGASDEEVQKFLVSRYGDFVLMRPPLNRATLLLWGGPALLLLAGGWLAFRAFRPARKGASS